MTMSKVIGAVLLCAWLPGTAQAISPGLVMMKESVVTHVIYEYVQAAAHLEQCQGAKRDPVMAELMEFLDTAFGAKHVARIGAQLHRAVDEAGRMECRIDGHSHLAAARHLRDDAANLLKTVYGHEQHFSR